jgi:hypothetical protein
MRTRPLRRLAPAGLFGAIALAVGLAVPACGEGFVPPIFTGNEAPDAASPTPKGSVPVLTPGCTGYECSVPSCPDGGATSISGTVYDPAGNNPLYNVVVYVPSSPPGALATGASCDSCNSLYSGGPVAAAVTDANGKFTIPNPPSGTSIPLVIQIGKWRKQTTVPSVTACTDNLVSTKLTLPSGQNEGDIPNIAISTGGADSLECLLLRIGIDPSEYEPGADGPGRIHIFQGSSDPGTDSYGAATTSPPAPHSSEALWNSVANLMPYDITILSCEGAETVDVGGGGITPSDQENLVQYTSAGGRVFASHFHYAWFDTGPFGAENIATWTRGANPITDSSNNPVSNVAGDFINANILTTLEDGGPFPKGQVMAEWLGIVGALNATSQPASGELKISGAKHNADLAGLAGTPSQGWIAADKNAESEIIAGAGPGTDAGAAASAAGATEYLSFNTPVDAGLDDAGEPAYCGRVVYSDLHVGAASQDYNGQGAGGIVPSGCANGPLSPQEKALEFMLFDLSSCVTPDNGAAQQPVPGPIH